MAMNLVRLKESLRPYIELDRRSLALMRVLAASIVLYDLVTRLFNLSAHYGIGSVMPPEALFHAGNGQAWFPFLPQLIQIVPHLPLTLIIAASVSVLLVLVGYRTRLNTVMSWVLLLMIQSMNLFVLSGADVVIRLIFFFGMFVPWGDFFSIDRARRGGEEVSPRIASIWTFALLLQISYIYFFAALLKSTGVDWQDGSAVYYALSTDLVTPLGAMLARADWILPFLTQAVRLFQLAIPFLFFFPIKTNVIRTAAVILLILMHMSFAFFLHLGTFSYISIAFLSCLLPSMFWHFLRDRFWTRFRGVTIYYDGDCGFCKRSSYLIQTILVPHAQIKIAQYESDIYGDMQRYDSWVIVDENGARSFAFAAAITLVAHSPLFFIAPILRVNRIQNLGEKAYRYIANHRSRACRAPTPSRILPLKVSRSVHAFSALSAFTFVVAVSVWNTGNVTPVQRPATFTGIMKATGIAQDWGLFAPIPRHLNYMYVADGTTEAGEYVRVFDMPHPYADERWRKYFQDITANENNSYRRYFLSYLCTEWNISHEGAERLASVDLFFVYTETLPSHQTSPKRVLQYASASCD